MSKLLLLSLLLLTPAVFAQDGMIASIETDQAEYAYGETMVFRYTLSNQTHEPVTLQSPSGSGCVARLRFAPGVIPHLCFFGDAPMVDFAPHSSRTWVWEVVPSEQGLPAVDGEQNVTGFFSHGDLPATTSFSAPQYLGGRLEVVLADSVTLGDVEDVIHALDAVVIDSVVIQSIGITYYYWQISGTTLEEACATYSSDPRFRIFSPLRSLPYPDVTYTVDDEDGAAPLPLTLTAARPNPFAVSTSFSLTVPTSGPARVEVFDLLGRRVAVLHDGPLAAGPEHHFTFHAATLPAGLYVVRATGEGFTETRRVTLVR